MYVFEFYVTKLSIKKIEQVCISIKFKGFCFYHFFFKNFISRYLHKSIKKMKPHLPFLIMYTLFNNFC